MEEDPCSQPWTSPLCVVWWDSHDPVLEVAPEGVGLVVLDLAVLDGRGAQEVVQLDGVDDGGSLLILGRGGTDPEVDVIPGAGPGLLGLQDRKWERNMDQENLNDLRGTT